MPALVIRCPQCPGIQQGTSVPIERLKQMLEFDEDITVMGSQCGHVWSLSATEKESLQKAVAAEIAFGKAAYGPQPAPPPSRKTRPAKQRKKYDPAKRAYQHTGIKGNRKKS